MKDQQTINFKDTIQAIVDSRPEVLGFLTANGFEQLKSPLLLKAMGKTMTLEQALIRRRINAEQFAEKLTAYLNQQDNGADSSLNRQSTGRGDVDIKGVLPCPIHMPLRDAITGFTRQLEAEHGIRISQDLRSANLGVDWIQDEPDIITSAGFELFFGKEMRERYLNPGIYSGGDYPVDPDLAARGADLKDPNGHYHIMGIVPAIFIVNTKMLDGRPCPRSWADLLKPEYAASVAIPRGDLDLYNAITLTIMAHHGEAGVRALGRATAVHLHPSQMTASKTADPLPLVNVAPYFFSQMVSDPHLEVVWPKDGAVVSPIFMIAKMDKPFVRPIVNHLCSPEIADIFSLNGKFPATAPGIDNHLEPNQRFLFAGWDYLNRIDVEAVLKRADELFTEGFEDAAQQFR